MRAPNGIRSPLGSPGWRRIAAEPGVVVFNNLVERRAGKGRGDNLHTHPIVDAH